MFGYIPVGNYTIFGSCDEHLAGIYALLDLVCYVDEQSYQSSFGNEVC